MSDPNFSVRGLSDRNLSVRVDFRSALWLADVVLDGAGLVLRLAGLLVVRGVVKLVLVVLRILKVLVRRDLGLV